MAALRPVFDSVIRMPVQPSPQYPRLIIVMGVCGCGKSTIAKALATALDTLYLDADDYHPASNIAKMSRGEALTDDDRWPWLKDFALALAQQETIVIGACSALRRSYREYITEAAAEPVLFIYLDGSKALISQRMAARADHFMPDSLLDSQLATLERPQADECAIRVDISGTTQEITRSVLLALSRHPLHT